MTTNEAKELFGYASWATARMFGAAEALTQEQLTVFVESRFPSILGTWLTWWDPNGSGCVAGRATIGEYVSAFYPCELIERIAKLRVKQNPRKPNERQASH